jgi:hypothetical protein
MAATYPPKGELQRFSYKPAISRGAAMKRVILISLLYLAPLMSAMAIGPGHSGSWYWPDQDGHGFSIEIGEQLDGSPFGVVYWYAYDNKGNPIFMVGTGVPSGDILEVALVSPVGMVYGEFDPASVIRHDGGTGRFVFTDEDTATFQYTPSEFTVENWGHSAIASMPLTKLFGIPVGGEEGYLGEFCWLTESEESLNLYRLGITHEGDGHHSVNGHVTERDPGEDWESSGPITGSMEIVGDERLMTLHYSSIDGFPPETSLLVSSVFHARLDAATLNGVGYGIIEFYNLTDERFEPKEAGGPNEIRYLPDCIVP